MRETQTSEYLCGLLLNESITVDYDLARILTKSEWKERASFLSTVLGDRRYGVSIDLGAGIGAVSAWAAQRSEHVIGFDLSRTHCLLYAFVMWQRGIRNTYVFQGTLDILGGKYRPDPVDLIVAYNGLTRRALLEQWTGISRYVRPNGLVLLAYPTLFFETDETSPESIALRDYGLTQGWGEQTLPVPPGMCLDAAGDAGMETSALPFLVKMADLPALFDFECGKATDAWTARTDVQLRLEYRLYRKLTIMLSSPFLTGDKQTSEHSS